MLEMRLLQLGRGNSLSLMARLSRVLGDFGLEGIKKVEMLMDSRETGIKEFSFLRRVKPMYRLSSKRGLQTVNKRLNKQRMSIKLMNIISK